MPRFLIAIHEVEADYARQPAPPERVWRAHDEFVAALAPLRVRVLQAEALAPRSQSVLLRGGSAGTQPVLTDDPLPRDVPRLGGFYLVEAPDLGTAVRAAGLCPTRQGYIEVRPVIDPQP